MSFSSSFQKRVKKHPMFRRFVFSFPFRLLLLDFKKNLLLIIFWLFFFAAISNSISPAYGVAFLFWGPEYLDKLSFFSYFILGFSLGGFIMAYNIASFIKNAFRFPFLASLRFPFLKYCLNNFIIPFAFTIYYCFKIYFFLRGEDVMNVANVFLMEFAFISGILLFLFVSLPYFYKANKDMFKLFGIKHKDELSYTSDIKNSGERNKRLIKESRDWYVETYLSKPFHTRLVRSVQHYKKEMLKDVIRQNQHTAFWFQLISIVCFLGIGFLGDQRIFEIPASASLFFLFTIFIMIFSSFYRWFRGWSTPVFILFLLGFNAIHKIDLFVNNRAYGLNYNTTLSDYSYDNFKKMDKRNDLLLQDINQTISTLNKWKIKNTDPINPNKKPKIYFLNTSGGGLRSSLWTLYTLTYTDSISKGKLLNHIQMVTGSSGGMVGAAYLRELYLQKKLNMIDNYYKKEYLTNISKDILNPIAFKVATSEWLFPMQSFVVNGNRYPKDRAFSFEEKLEENLNNVFNKNLSDYYVPESNAEIPMMVFSPSIVNDGRKLMISPLGISYLTQNARTTKTYYNRLFDAIEYSRFFEKQGAGNTRFTSVLRMSATFPYISPVVSLPSEPRIEIMDAGLRDNYGLETSLRFIRAFNDWIAENTSGIVIIQIRDKHKNIPIDENPPQTMAQSLTRPMGSFYGNLFEVQDYNQNQQILNADAWCKSKIEIIDLQLRNDKSDHISLSWHLTAKEKRKVLASLYLPENQESIKRIIELLK